MMVSESSALGRFGAEQSFGAAMASARDLPRLLAAVRAVEEVISDIETQARFRSDWEDGRAALADEIRRALADALEGEG